MNSNQHININLSNLTLVIPAKEESDCLYNVLEELQNFNIHKIIVIPSDRSLLHLGLVRWSYVQFVANFLRFLQSCRQ